MIIEPLPEQLTLFSLIVSVEMSLKQHIPVVASPAERCTLLASLKAYLAEVRDQRNIILTVCHLPSEVFWRAWGAHWFQLVETQQAHSLHLFQGPLLYSGTPLIIKQETAPEHI